MKNGRLIALSALTSALGVIFLVFGAYFQTFDLSCLFMACICIMFPLSKNSVKGALLSYFAILLLSFIFTAGRFYVSILFGIFFGLYPIVNYFELKKDRPIIWVKILKCIWFVITIAVMVYLFRIFTAPNEFIDKILPYIVIFGGIVGFVVFEFIMLRFQKMTKILIERLKL